MKLVTAILFNLISFVLAAQTKDLSTLPAYDCSLKKVMAIIGRQTIIASPDRPAGLETILDDYCSTFGDNCIRKKESELTNADYSKDILMVGLFSNFKNWDKLNTPIKSTTNGFIINNKIFQSTGDGFVFVDTNRIIISGNSLKAVKEAQLALTGGHDILLTQNGKITYFGNRKNNTQFEWFNLQELKQTNYTKKPSKLFSAIFVSRSFNDTINYAKLNEEIAKYAQQFIRIYKLKMPAKKVSWFLHSNMTEYGIMSGMFGLTCPGNNSAGFSIRGEIHTYGFNTPLVKHEYSHFLFDNTIPQDNNPAFFVEGCVEYVTNLNDKNLYKERVAIAKRFKDTLNFKDLIIDNKDFYGQYSAANYSVCGVFVKYIVDNFGVDAFKKYCLVNKRQSETEKAIFKIDFETLVKGYKDWLDKQ